MSTSAPPPKFPAWIFYASDLALLAAAGYIAAGSARPLSNAAIFGIVACVIAGATLATIPRLVAYERDKNAVLDERQTALEGLSQTIANSAEQLSIAASGLNEIAELAHKNLRQAEQLPHKLQEKIAEFQAQLANATDAEKEELEKELASLRASESERLESVSDRIAKSVTEFSRLQTQLQKQLAAAAQISAQVPPAATPATPTVAPAATPAPTAAPAIAPAAIPAAAAAPALNEAYAPESGSVAASTPALAKPEPAAVPTPAASPAETPRRTRREESSTRSAVSAASPSPRREETVDEPRPVQPLEIAPVAPHSHPPYPDHLIVNPVKAPANPENGQTAEASVAVAAKPPRKRPEKKTSALTADALPGLELVAVEDSPATPAPAANSPTLAALVSEFAQMSPDETQSAPALAADGATRVLVTAYIGIGNRLFIRGEGAGLSWQKGIPLQFVSIGKWRWEAADVSAPVRFKLYKNDDTECAALGSQTLAPGHQQELTATF